MSKFIKVTDKKSGKKVIISGDFDVRSDNFNTVVFHHGGMIKVSESIEQIESQLLRDEFAMRSMQTIQGAITTQDGSNRYTQAAYDSDIAEHAYCMADAMLRERNK